jgi:hypothetical protein
MVPSSNSVDLARRLPNAELVLYADAGHGGIFQHHEYARYEGRAAPAHANVRLHRPTRRPSGAGHQRWLGSARGFRTPAVHR